MKRILLSFIICHLAFSSVAAQSGTVNVNGTTRKYIAYVPQNLGEDRPLLISCHGMNQDANYQRGMLSIESVADTGKFVTVFPEGIDKSWDISGDRDINFMKALINEMVTKYHIDRDRVYLSGFSMGGMFTYHAMNKMADKIAAFAPISGYPMWGGNYSSSRPVPIIHTHGTADDVVAFSGVQSVLNGWINRNKCSSTPKIYNRYRGASHITRRVWGNGLEGTEVVLMEMADKGHWISNDNGVLTGDEIWRFCQRYTLNKTRPRVSITTPRGGSINYCFAPKDIAAFPPIELTVNAKDPNGTIDHVDVYDNDELVATLTAEPYTITLKGLSTGKHQFKAVAIDNDGENGTGNAILTCSNPQAVLALSQQFKEDGSIPYGWLTHDGNTKRVGYDGGFTAGCRVIQMTGSQHSFSFGLYIRNATANAGDAYAKFAAPGTTSSLFLYPGNYELRYKICNWNRPQFSPVTICVEHADADLPPIVSEQYTPTVNIGNKASNNFTGVNQMVLPFTVTMPGLYNLAFYADTAAMADAVIGYVGIAPISYDTSGIDETLQTTDRNPSTVYDLQGRRLATPLKKGLYIVNGKKIIK